MILIAYDGTPSADRAIAVAASLVRGGRAHVVHVWGEPPADTREALSVSQAIRGVDEEDAREEAAARAVADAGAALARSAGFQADAEAIRRNGTTAAALEGAIDRLRPELVVIGSRGLLGLEALLERSVSHHVGAHAHAPVLIVPPAR